MTAWLTPPPHSFGSPPLLQLLPSQLYETPTRLEVRVRPRFLPPGLGRYCEYYNKDGSESSWGMRRDMQPGRSFGRMYMTTCGMLVFRWGAGSGSGSGGAQGGRAGVAYGHTCCHPACIGCPSWWLGCAPAYAAAPAGSVLYAQCAVPHVLCNCSSMLTPSCLPLLHPPPLPPAAGGCHRVYTKPMFSDVIDTICEEYMILENRPGQPQQIVARQCCFHVASEQSASQFLVGNYMPEPPKGHAW